MNFCTAASAAALVGEEAAHVRGLLVEPVDRVVAVGERGGELLQVVHGGEQVLVAARQRLPQLAELGDRVVEGLAVAVGVLRERVQQVRQRAVLVGPVGSQRGADPVEARVEVVDLERGRGALARQDRALGHLGPAGVGRRELHVPVAHQRRRHDHGLRVRRQLGLPVDEHLHPHQVALRLDGVDVPDLDAEHAHVVVLVEPDDAGEHRGVAALVRVDQQPPQGGGHHQRHHHGDGDAPAEIPAEPGLGGHDGFFPRQPSSLRGPSWGGSRPQM
jgi:hypothetical protein